MELAITINFGLTPQLAGFLAQALGAQRPHQAETDYTYVEKEAEPGRTDAKAAADPFAAATAGAPVAEAEQVSSASATAASTDTAKGTRGRKKSSEPSAASQTDDPFANAAKAAQQGAPAGNDPFAAGPTAAPAKQLAGDAFSDQVKQAAAAADAEQVTTKDLNDAAQALVQSKGTQGAKIAQGIINKYQDATGKPCDRLSVLQPGDYAAAVADMRMALQQAA